MQYVSSIEKIGIVKGLQQGVPAGEAKLLKNSLNTASERFQPGFRISWPAPVAGSGTLGRGCAQRLDAGRRF